MINYDQSTLLLHFCEDVKSHRSGGDTVPKYIILNVMLNKTNLIFLAWPSTNMVSKLYDLCVLFY